MLENRRQCANPLCKRQIPLRRYQKNAKTCSKKCAKLIKRKKDQEFAKLKRDANRQTREYWKQRKKYLDESEEYSYTSYLTTSNSDLIASVGSDRFGFNSSNHKRQWSESEIRRLAKSELKKLLKEHNLD